MAAVPEWLRELQQNIQAGVAHMYALTLNVTDLCALPGDDGSVRYHTVKQVLREAFADRRLVITYDPSSGISFGGRTSDDCKRMESEFRKLANYGAHGDKLEALDPSLALPLLERILTVTAAEAKARAGLNPEDFGSGSVAVIIGYAETVATAGDVGQKPSLERTNIVTLARWARSRQICERQNVVLLLTVNAADLSTYIRTATDVVSIRVPLPAVEERDRFLTDQVARLPGLVLAEGATVGDLARASAGLSLRALEDILRLSAVGAKPLDLEHLWVRKKQVIERMSGGLLEVIRPAWTFEHVGALDHVKAYLREVASAIRQGKAAQVPQGILFTGPPGTGKSIMAEALANELGIPMVRLKAIHSMWLGQSERNLELVLDLIEELAPVVVFEDEIDQQEVQRGNVFHGDGGANARLMARKMAFLSDTRHAGRILWLAATNRPDLMDAALLRAGRFDVKIPFLLPTPSERPAILAALMRKLSTRAERDGAPIAWEIPPETATQVSARCEGYSGSELEVLLKRAVAFAARDGRTTVTGEDLTRARDDAMMSHSKLEYELMTIEALLRCDSLELLPPEYHEAMRRIETAEGMARYLELRRAFGKKPPSPGEDPEAKA